mmetsp:Transcript_32894/g.60424  ORF Transcript_32894/g.60424 Transcript_32894/m.60424 type:complete len:415 (+) Transcript_32894:55-1299(+)
MQAASRHRSRSPATSRHSKSKLPALKTWVLVIAETSPKKRCWKNAVPGLVSKVSQGLSDTRVNVLIPNLLGLRYGFTGPRYAELKDLKLSDIRVYKGHDSTTLKDALVKAVQEAAKRRVSVGEDERLPKAAGATSQQKDALSGNGSSETTLTEEMNDDAPEVAEPSSLRGSLNLATDDASSMGPLSQAVSAEHESTQPQCPEEQQVAQSCMAAPVSFSSLSPPASPLAKSWQSPASFQRDTTQENINAFFNAPPLSASRFSVEGGIQSSQSTQAHKTQANIAAPFSKGGVVISANAAVEAKEHESEATPTTPVASHRNLMRNDTPIAPEIQAAPQSNACGGKSDSLDKSKLLQIIAAVSKAFRDAKEDVLTKQSLEITVAKGSLGISCETFNQALVQLDARNKILLNDDLVFLV